MIAEIDQAAEHAIRWFAVEEKGYASRAPGKFGYIRNLHYLRQGRMRPESVWAGQMGNYWLRGVALHSSARDIAQDNIAARQQFAKQTNAARALLTTLVVTEGMVSYEMAKTVEEEVLRRYAHSLGVLPFTNSASFDHGAYWRAHLAPARQAIEVALNDETVDEQIAFSAGIKPVQEFMLGTFDVLLAHIVADGPLPQPGVPNGEIRPWPGMAI